jgi:dTDP-L-rhamnose 4-epimerase
MPTEKVLVTGGAGFIGSQLVARLCDQGCDVIVVDVLHPQVHRGGRPASLPLSATLFPFDVVHAPAWDALFRLFRPDTIVHLAAETGTGQSLQESTRHGMVNVVGTTQMLDALVRASHVPSHLVLSSSRAVYGEGEWETGAGRFYPAPRSHGDLEAGLWDPRSPTGEVAKPVPSMADRTRTAPTSVYGATKLAQEQIIGAWATAFGSSVSVLRFQNVYGVGQSLTNPYTGVLSLFTQMAVRREPLPVYEDGQIVRDFVYVDDVVDALCRALSSPPERSRLLDIGSGTTTTLLEVATLLASLSGAPDPRVTGAFRDGDVRAASCDVTKARVDLAYEPRWDLRSGLEALTEWVRSQIPVEART